MTLFNDRTIELIGYNIKTSLGLKKCFQTLRIEYKISGSGTIKRYVVIQPNPNGKGSNLIRNKNYRKKLDVKL